MVAVAELAPLMATGSAETLLSRSRTLIASVPCGEAGGGATRLVSVTGFVPLRSDVTLLVILR